MTDAIPPVGIYARVSTSEQSTDGQVSALEEYCRRQRWTDVRVFRDDGISGVRDNRPALDVLRSEIRAGRIGVVLATKLDRLGRSVLGVLSFFKECEAANVRVVVIDQGFDTSTATGRLTRDVLAALAEFERELILERTQSGVKRARQRGVRFGRTPKAVSADVLGRIQTLKAQGESVRRIAQLVGISRSRVVRLTAVSNVPPPPRTTELRGGPSPGSKPPSFGTPIRREDVV